MPALYNKGYFESNWQILFNGGAAEKILSPKRCVIIEQDSIR
jgi:hypothetical protein